MSNTITTGEVRFSFVSVFIPREVQEGQEAKYSVTLLIPKSDTATFNAIQSEINLTLQNAVASTFGGQMPTRPATPLYDGDGARPSGELFGEECRGHWVITASSKQKPQVVDENVQAIIDTTSFYSGCYGRASIRFFAYNKAGRKGIGCGLGNVQKLRDGEAFGGGTTATQDFGTPQQPAYQQPTPQQPAFQQLMYQQPTPTQQQINPLTGLPYTPSPVGGVMGI